MIVAMHAPDGFLEPPVALVTALLSSAVVGGALRATSKDLGDRHVPVAGVTAAFVFAAQMVNFPVASGTTGHLLGGALAAILLGPWAGAAVVTVVVVAQGLLFADGGVTALGYNTLNMAVVPAFGGWALFRVFRTLLPTHAGGVVGAAGLAAGASVVLSAMAFSLEWLFGASAPVAFDTVFSAVVGVHVFIGIGEGVITAAVVSAVLVSRPDLVEGARDLETRVASGRDTVGLRPFAIAAVLVALVLAVVVGQFSAEGPDGLESAAEDAGFEESASEHALSGSVFADYAVRGISNEPLSLAIAGATGVAVTLIVSSGIVHAARRGRGHATATG